MREMQGTKMEPDGGVTTRSLSPGWVTNTQGAPRLLDGEVVSATRQVERVRRIKTNAVTGLFLCQFPIIRSSLSDVERRLLELPIYYIMLGLPYDFIF